MIKRARIVEEKHVSYGRVSYYQSSVSSRQFRSRFSPVHTNICEARCIVRLRLLYRYLQKYEVGATLNEIDACERIYLVGHVRKRAHLFIPTLRVRAHLCSQTSAHARAFTESDMSACARIYLDRHVRMRAHLNISKSGHMSTYK